MKISYGVAFVCLRLLECSFRSLNCRFRDLDFVIRPGLIRQSALFTGVCYINAADLRGDSTGFILNLAFEFRLSSKCILQSVQIRPIVNFVQQVAFFNKIVIVDG